MPDRSDAHRSSWGWPLAALTSAILVRATVPPYSAAPLALVAWVPLLTLIGRAPLRIVLSAATLQGVVLASSAQAWVMPGLERAVAAPPWAAVGAWVALSLVQGLRTPLVFALVHLGARSRCPIWLTFPIAQAAVEEIYPTPLPWTLALQVHAMPEWLQAAALAGPGAVTLWLGLVNGLLAQAWLARSRPWVARSSGVAALVVLALADGFGRLAIAREDARDARATPARIVLGHVVTPAGRDEAPDPVPELRSRTLAALERSGPVDLVVWPETVVRSPTPVRRISTIARDYLLRDRREGARAPVIAAPLLFGLVVDDGGRLHNSAALVRHPGAVLGRYDKRALAPVGESSRLLPGLPDLGAIVPVATRFTSGAEPTPLLVADHAIAVSICYEDLLPALVRQSVLTTQPELLINLTSDAWFRGSDAPELHLALAKLRAIEHRKYLIRSTRDGASAVIDSAGRVRQRLDDSAEPLVATARWLPGLTPYARHGSSWLLALTALPALVSLARARRRQGAPTPSPTPRAPTDRPVTRGGAFRTTGVRATGSAP